MTDNVTPINDTVKPKTGEPSAGLIAALKAALAMAETGELQSLICTGFLAGGERISFWAPDHENVIEMLGALAWLQHEYVNCVTAGDRQRTPT